MRLVHLRAETDEDVDCLMRELCEYSPKRAHHMILIELEGRLRSDLLTLLTAVEESLSGNNIRSVWVEIDGQTYMMEPP
jgi:hypothetical protein